MKGLKTQLQKINTNEGRSPHYKLKRKKRGGLIPKKTKQNKPKNKKQLTSQGRPVRARQARGSKDHACVKPEHWQHTRKKNSTRKRASAKRLSAKKQTRRPEPKIKKRHGRKKRGYLRLWQNAKHTVPERVTTKTPQYYTYNNSLT